MSPFDDWLKCWSLTIDGPAIRTASSDLVPVVRDGVPAMLKIARSEEELRGASLMVWYEGNGAARVLNIDGPALLLERPQGSQSLVEMSKEGLDDEATRILCATAHRLHAPREQGV